MLLGHAASGRAASRCRREYRIGALQARGVDGRRRAMAGVDWSRITFTEHMTEAAAVVGLCEVVIDFESAERTSYEIRVYQGLKGHGDEPYFAVATNRDDPDAFRPIGTGASAEMHSRPASRTRASITGVA